LIGLGSSPARSAALPARNSRRSTAGTNTTGLSAEPSSPRLGFPRHAPGEYEVDHLISLELVGSNTMRDLWPEPYAGADNAHTKDSMENRLHADVCAGRITLARGQDEIVHWWMYE
jgi:hypothetical protein